MSATASPFLFYRAELTLDQRDEMFALLSRHFQGVTRRQFDLDLAEKNWVVEVRKEGHLVGFSTLLVREAVFEEEPFTVIYSGDTIVSPEGWGSPALARNWIAAVNRLRMESPARRCYWVLLTAGFRTYRFLPVFWREFFPRFDGAFPADRRRLMDALAESQYGDFYDRETGLVRFPNPQSLRGKLGGIPEGRQSDEHISFFLANNPGHVHGDELVCLTEISESNLTPAGFRMVRA